jgi:hypothetical protein
MEQYSIVDCYTLGEMLVLREHRYPIELLKRIIEACHSTLSEEDVLAILLDEPLPWQSTEEMVQAEDRGETQKVLFPPHIVEETLRRMKPLANYLRRELQTA